VRSRSSFILVNFVPLLRKHNFSIADISHTSCQRMTKFSMVRGLANRHLFPEFRELWSGGPAIPCGDLHHSFTDALVIIFSFERARYNYAGVCHAVVSF